MASKGKEEPVVLLEIISNNTIDSDIEGEAGSGGIQKEEEKFELVANIHPDKFLVILNCCQCDQAPWAKHVIG